MFTALKQKIQFLKRESYALYLVYRDPRCPWYARVFTALVVAHTFSPIDLIPDFIPLLGYLDDLLITPIGIFLALKMIPPQIMTEARQQAETLEREGKLTVRAGAALVITLWLLGLAFLLFVLYRLYLFRD
jgi:uncharacterized membrane protein YkvA (DUF1232 family)